MSKKENIIQQYIECFDDCRALDYKGIHIKPFLAKDIRKCNYACYCLVVDPLEFNDITLMPLKRLDLILTLISRKENNQVPIEMTDKYDIFISSFFYLTQTLFSDYIVKFGDPLNPKRKKAITFIEKSSLQDFQEKKLESYKFVTLSTKDFEDLSELIPYHNGIDMSYKQIPAAMRKDADKVRDLMNKKNKSKSPSIEKMIDAAFLHIKNYEIVLNLPVRKFYNLITNIQKREDYSILMSGMYVVKSVEHWMAGDYTKNSYDGVFQTESELKENLKKM